MNTKYKKFVAYFDILGYRERIQNKNIEEEFEIQKKLLEDINKCIRTSREIIKCDVISFSDTHVLFSDDFSRIIRGSLLFMMIAAIRAVLYLPVRGAISYGDFLFDKKNKIIVGNALREAYLLEKEQEWLGCCLTDSCCEIGKNYSSKAFEFFQKKGVLVNYKVPFKENKRVNKYVINMESYPRVWGRSTANMRLSNEFINNIFINRTHDDKEILKLNDEALAKLKNTQEFFNYIEDIKKGFES